MSALASRFEKAAEKSGPAEKITNIASRFAQSTSSGAAAVGPKKPAAPAVFGGASAIAARNAPTKQVEEEESAPSVMDVAARFRASEKAAEKAESAFSAAKGTFLKGEATTRPKDAENKIMAAASMFGDTVGAKPGGAARRSTDSKPAAAAAPSRAGKLVEESAGFAKASSIFQSGASAVNAPEENQGPSQKERFADAAKMFGGN